MDLTYNVQLPPELQNAIQKSVTDAINDALITMSKGLNQGYLTKQEAAKYLHISNNTLSKWVTSKGLRPCVIEGVIRFQRSYLDKFMEKHMQK